MEGNFKLLLIQRTLVSEKFYLAERLLQTRREVPCENLVKRVEKFFFTTLCK